MANKKIEKEETKAKKVTETTKTSKPKTTKTKKPVVKKEEPIKEEVVVAEVIEEKTEEIVSAPVKKRKVNLLIFIISLLMILGIGGSCYFFIFKDTPTKNNNKTDNKLPKLPKPEVAEGERGQLGIDKNINEKVIDKYLNREDAVYRDMRMLEDPAEYENIGGDRYLSGYIKGFEIVPLPYIIPVNNLPKEVGETYTGNTLFFKMSDGTYVPMYKESMDIIEELFPKDKIIFLMCGGGGYAGMMKEFLVSQGWNKNKIYVVGGYWYYEGKNSVEVPKKKSRDRLIYDFSEVPYHDIDFAELTEIEPDRHTGKVTPFYIEDEYYGGKDEKFEALLEKSQNSRDDFDKTHKDFDYDEYYDYVVSIQNEQAEYINKLMQNKKSFLVSVYNDYGCGDDDDTIRTKALAFTEANDLYTYDISVDILFKTDIVKDVKNTPNFIIIKEGKVYTFYYNESDEDLKILESDEATAKWIKKYIKLK